MKSYFASYQPNGSDVIDTTVLIFDKSLNIGFRNPDGSSVMINWPLKEVEASFDLPTQRTRLRNKSAGGGVLWVSGKEAMEFVLSNQKELAQPWYKKSSGREWMRNGFLLLLILGILFTVYLLIVPWLSSKLASKVSVKTERQLGDAVYDAMDLALQEDTARSFILNNFFSVMDVPSEYSIRISVINNSTINAFALPGGRIVVYSALLDEVDSYPELAALLSHEFTHVDQKHSTKSIFRRLGSKIFLGVLFGRFGAVTSVLVNHADNLKSLKYSRSLEKEADMEGLRILQKRKIDPQGFVDLFTHLKASASSNSLPEFLASHPDVDRRISYVKEAAAGSEVRTDSALKAIFEKLK